MLTENALQTPDSASPEFEHNLPISPRIAMLRVTKPFHPPAECSYTFRIHAIHLVLMIAAVLNWRSESSSAPQICARKIME